uniref:Uncharacterized protein n=1 Tax=Arundo donax TaxID=35708 RepID=A0A0A8ZCK2_ARUDO
MRLNSEHLFRTVIQSVFRMLSVDSDIVQNALCGFRVESLMTICKYMEPVIRVAGQHHFDPSYYNDLRRTVGHSGDGS